jgi:ketosteroid isomerase-like protein
MKTYAVLFVAAAGLAVGQFVAVGKGPAQPVSAQPAVDPPAAEGQRAADFLAAFNKGDAKALAGFWTPDGDYMDQAGSVHKGRAAIEAFYAKGFAANKGSKLNVVVTSKRQLGADVILEEGLT